MHFMVTQGSWLGLIICPIPQLGSLLNIGYCKPSYECAKIATAAPTSSEDITSGEARYCGERWS